MASTIGRRKFSYYSFAKVLSYNATMNHCVGGRGIGKTYGAKKKVTKDAIKDTVWKENVTITVKRGIEYVETNETGECFTQFVYVRRYKDELALARETFFADFKHEFPDYDFRSHSEGKLSMAQMSPVKYAGMTKGRPWVTIGFFVPLSVAQSFKSVAFPHVKWIIFDEYIIEKGATHYLPNEATAFNNFYSTIDRYQDKTRVLFLANSVSITNPYFLDKGISPDDVDENGFVRMDDGYLIVHFIESEKFESEVYQTRFGKYIQGTEYADYAVGNQFSDNNKQLIGKKGSKAYYMFSIETERGIFSVWFDPTADKYFALERKVKDGQLYTVVPRLMAENKILLTRSHKTLATLRSAFNHDRFRFDTPVSKNALMEIFK